jgi:hypothetical protein
VRALFLGGRLRDRWGNTGWLTLAYVLAMGGAIVAPEMTGQSLRLQGNWSGKVTPDERLPEIPWRVKVDTLVAGEKAGEIDAELIATLPGGEITLLVSGGGTTGGYDWKLMPQRMGVSAWQETARKFVPELADVGLAGEVEISGDGTWGDSGASGELSFRWRPSALTWWIHSAVLNEVDVAGTIVLADSEVVGMRTEVSWVDAKVGAVGMKQGRLEARLNEAGLWMVEKLTVALWGGRVSLTTFTFDPSDMKVETTLQVAEVAAAEVAQFVPQALTSATGRLSGEFDLNWSEAAGFRPGQGTLAMIDPENSSVRMAPAPGLLSSRVPKRIETLPGWLGPIARWAAVENPAHDDLIAIEMGERSLAVERLEVQLYPDGQGGLRTVRAELMARPMNSPGVKRVSFGINVMGPWEDLVMLSTSQGASILIKP